MKKKERIKELERRIKILEHFAKNHGKNICGRKYSLLDAETDMIMADLDRR